MRALEIRVRLVVVLVARASFATPLRPVVAVAVTLQQHFVAAASSGSYFGIADDLMPRPQQNRRQIVMQRN